MGKLGLRGEVEERGWSSQGGEAMVEDRGGGARVDERRYYPRLPMTGVHAFITSRSAPAPMDDAAGNVSRAYMVRVLSCVDAHAS